MVLFGRIEQEVIEISWLLKDAQLKERLKLARIPAAENFITIIESVEKLAESPKLDGLKSGFRMLADDRNLIVHGAWVMTDDKPWVVWHKFAEDTESVIGEHFEAWRFERFMTKGTQIFTMLKNFHGRLEVLTNKKTSAIPRT